jgi:hypothetical protein
MKNIFYKATILFITLSILSCNEDEIVTPPFEPVVYKERFNPDFLQEDEYMVFDGWKSFTEAGTIQWTEQNDDNGYIQFTTFGFTQSPPENVNIAWAISPKINLDNSTNEVLDFRTSSEFVTDPNNKLEVFISTDFDGTNVLAATWIPVVANLASNTNNIPSGSSDGFINIESGQIDLSTITGSINIAFKATGSETDNNLDGSLRVDDIKIYQKK